MKSSVLIGIIQRLEAMIASDSNEPEVRRFELDGVEKCQVIYHLDDSFELIETSNGMSYRFDDLDLVAMEIYDLLG